MKKNPKIIYGILSMIIVVLLVIIVVIVKGVFDSGNSSVSEALANGELGGTETVSPTAGAEESNGIYAEYTEPTEEPIDIYYVENNFDAAASDIKPTVSEEGWYIENVGCLEGVENISGIVYDEEMIRKFENSVFQIMRNSGIPKLERANELGKLTIDTRTLITNHSCRPIYISFNGVGLGGMLLTDLCDNDEELWLGNYTNLAVEPMIHNNMDYIINLEYLKKNEQVNWSDGLIKNFQKHFYKYIEQENLQVGMCAIDYDTIRYNEEVNEYYFTLYVYEVDDLMISVTYIKDEDKWRFTRHDFQ